MKNKTQKQECLACKYDAKLHWRNINDLKTELDAHRATICELRATLAALTANHNTLEVMLASRTAERDELLKKSAGTTPINITTCNGKTVVVRISME